MPDEMERGKRQSHPDQPVERLLMLPQGEKIKPNMKKTIDAYVAIDKVQPNIPVIVYQDICFCSEDDAPTRLDEETCIKAGRIQLDLSNIVKEERKKLEKEGKARATKRLDIDIKIELTCGSDKGVLEATGKVGLRRVGACKIEYFADPQSGS